MSASFVIGVALAGMWQVGIVLLSLGVLAGFVGLLYRRVLVVAVLVFAGLVMGNSYGTIHWQQQQALQSLNGSHLSLTGRVKEDPTHAVTTRLTMDSLKFDGYNIAGTIWVDMSLRKDILRGDIVTLEGKLQEGFGNFAGTLSRPKVISHERPVPGDIGRVVRDWFSERVRQFIDEPQVSLGLGYITGQKTSLSEELSEALRIVGLTHIVVASGYNLTILVRLARRLFKKYSKFASFSFAFSLMLAFVSVTGLSPSMTRAALVSGISLLLLQYGRVVHPVVLLCIIGALTVAWQPSFAWGDVGWMLSFSAFAGVMLIAPLFQVYFFGPEPPGTIRQILGETVAAHIVTLPIIMYYFGSLSHVAIMANILVVPLVPLAMLLTFVTGVAGFVWPWLAGWIGWGTEQLLAYMINVATYLAELPWAQSDVEAPVWALGVYVVALVGLAWYAKVKTGYRFLGYNPVE